MLPLCTAFMRAGTEIFSDMTVLKTINACHQKMRFLKSSFPQSQKTLVVAALHGTKEVLMWREVSMFV